MEPVILFTCLDMDKDWFWPRWALLMMDKGKGQKSRLITIYRGGIHIINEYHIDDMNSASFWARLKEIDKIKKELSTGFRHEEQMKLLNKMLAILQDDAAG